jgi:ATP-binding cassette, subfamily B, bacterial PglK
LNLKNLLISLWHHIDAKRRLQLYLVVLLMFVSAIAEAISIGSIIPFLAVLSAPKKLFENAWMTPFLLIFNIDAPDKLLLPITFLFGIITIISGGIKLSLLWIQNRVCFGISETLTKDAYLRTLYQPYESHIKRNSSEIISGIIGKVGGVVFISIIPVLNIISSSVVLFFVIGLLLWVNVVITLLTLLAFVIVYLFVLQVTKNQLLKEGQIITTEQNQMVKVLQEGLGGIREIILNGSQRAHIRFFQRSNIPLRRSSGNIAIIGGVPRHLIETTGIIILACVAYYVIISAEDIALVIPSLGVLAMCAQRTLPLLQQIYVGLSTLRGGAAILSDAINILSQKTGENLFNSNLVDIEFINCVSFKNISFSYSSDAPKILDEINLVIRQGSRVGVVGITGGGKSTFLDIFMGLLTPTAGQITIDDCHLVGGSVGAWQKLIAHVPQQVFLADTTIAENIAMTTMDDGLDMRRVISSARKAQIADTIEALEEGYETIVGERGIKLSVGQRQRIGIARAFYKNANVFVLDEATSALDSETEEKVMLSFENLDKKSTIIMVAHRTSTLKSCDTVIKFMNGKISEIGSYSDVCCKTQA